MGGRTMHKCFPLLSARAADGNQKSPKQRHFIRHVPRRLRRQIALLMLACAVSGAAGPTFGVLSPLQGASVELPAPRSVRRLRRQPARHRVLPNTVVRLVGCDLRGVRAAIGLHL